MDLQTIPGIGPAMERDLRVVGITKVADLKGKDPEALYVDLCTKRRKHIDRCVLYIFRCAVYYASRKKHKKELLNWWNWKG